MPARIKSFCLIVFDREQRIFSVEGPMKDDTAWNEAVCRAQNSGRVVNCCTGNGDISQAASEYQAAYGYRRVASGTIVDAAHLD